MSGPNLSKAVISARRHRVADGDGQGGIVDRHPWWSKGMNKRKIRINNCSLCTACQRSEIFSQCQELGEQKGSDAEWGDDVANLGGSRTVFQTIVASAVGVDNGHLSLK